VLKIAGQKEGQQPDQRLNSKQKEAEWAEIAKHLQQGDWKKVDDCQDDVVEPG
jgi:hypothetical protein